MERSSGNHNVLDTTTSGKAAPFFWLLLISLTVVQSTDSQNTRGDSTKLPLSQNIYPTAVPNDPMYFNAWNLNNGDYPGIDIQAETAWDIQADSPEVVVAIIDTGIDLNHEDLKDNIWTNPFEIPENGIDDDNNGYIDDIHGYDFAENDNSPMDIDTGAFPGHGTRVAGIIAATGNNGIGTTGVTWKTKLMPLKYVRDDGSSGSKSAVVQAIKYAVNMGAGG